MESHGGRLRELPRQGAESGEGTLRRILPIAAHGGGHLCLGIPRREGGGRRELALGGNRPAEPLEREAVEQLRPHVAATGGTLERLELLWGRERSEPLRRLEGGQEERESLWRVGVEQVVRSDRRGRVRLLADGRAPGAERLVRPAGPEAREWSWTTALRGCSVPRRSTRDRLLSGQAANACPIKACGEEKPAKTRAALVTSPSE